MDNNCYRCLYDHCIHTFFIFTLEYCKGMSDRVDFETVKVIRLSVCSL
jgi:hypothetical protein